MGADSKIAELAADVSSATAELKDATTIRDAEASDFAASETELVDVIDTLGRAITLIEREMQKKNAAFTQLGGKDLKGLVQSLDTLVDAAALSASDKHRLSALIQSTQGANEDEDELGAPAAAVYESHSSSIVDTLEDLKEKAEEQLSSLRKAEVNARHNYGMVKQSLEDQMAADNKELGEEKTGKAAASESKAGAEGDLTTTVAGLKAAEDALATAQATCAQVSENHEATVAARSEELKVISDAIGVLKGTTSGAEGQAYSFLQFGTNSGVRIRTRADLARSEVLTIVNKLAQQHHSTALAQLAKRIAAVLRFSASSGDDPFSKVKGLINELITRLEAEAGSEATEKSFCDDETAKSNAQKSDLEATLSKLTAAIDASTARSASLKADVKELSEELAQMAKEQADMIRIRQESHANYVQAKSDYEEGLGGVRKALVMLREYYAEKEGGADAAFAQVMRQPAMPETHTKATGSGTSIIGILEVVESDFATNLAKEETTEAEAQEAHEKMIQENKITKATKDQDIKYKTAEAASLDKEVAELSSDRETARTEHAAVLEYLEKLNARCIAKPETYETRKQRREAEISGLKEALAVLEQTSFFQRVGGKRMKGHMRGTLRVDEA